MEQKKTLGAISSLILSRRTRTRARPAPLIHSCRRRRGSGGGPARPTTFSPLKQPGLQRPPPRPTTFSPLKQPGLQRLPRPSHRVPPRRQHLRAHRHDLGAAGSPQSSPISAALRHHDDPLPLTPPLSPSPGVVEGQIHPSSDRILPLLQT